MLIVTLPGRAAETATPATSCFCPMSYRGADLLNSFSLYLAYVVSPLQLALYPLESSDLPSLLLLCSSLTSVSSSVRTRCLILGWDQTIYQYLALVCFIGSDFHLTVWTTKIQECSIPLPGFKSGPKTNLADRTGTRRRLNELTYPHICFRISLNQKHISQMRMSPLLKICRDHLVPIEIIYVAS